MSEMLTFANFKIGIDDVQQVGAVPARAGNPARRGVMQDLGVAFGYEGTDYSELIGHVAPHRELQHNIEHAVECLSDPSVKASLGYENWSAINIARDFVQRSGLIEKVDRTLMPGQGDFSSGYDVGVLPERVINWQERMADEAILFARAHRVGFMALASSERPIGENESLEVAAGKPTAVYMEETVKPRLEMGVTRTELATGSAEPRRLFDTVDVLKTGEDKGDNVMVRAAEMLAERGIDPRAIKVVVFAVAGNWIQSASQARNGFQAVFRDFDTDENNRQLRVVSDAILLGKTGEEPKVTHQNPFSALGNIPRSGLFIQGIAESR